MESTARDLALRNEETNEILAHDTGGKGGTLLQ